MPSELALGLECGLICHIDCVKHLNVNLYVTYIYIDIFSQMELLVQYEGLFEITGFWMDINVCT